MNYKIKVNSEAESKEVQELFFELGGKWTSGEVDIKYTTQPFLFLDGRRIRFCCNDSSFNERHNQELTITELRDIVVQHRKKESGMITGKEALMALANGDEVEFHNPFQDIWNDIKSLTISEIEGCVYVCPDDGDKIKTKFCLKPKTILINGVEVPAPFNYKILDTCWILSDDCKDGYRSCVYTVEDAFSIGAWRTEGEIKQVVAALRKVFGGV